MSHLATLTIQGRFATLTLNRPDARNAMTPELLDTLLSLLPTIEPGVTVLVLTGAGPAFCAGMDLKAIATDEALRDGLPLALLTKLADLTIQLRALPAVVVAKVAGAAIGGGCGLATVADIAVTHADAKLGFPEVDLGLCPAVVAPWLVRKVGPGRARRILLAGGVMTGQRAHELGIVDHVVPTRAELDAFVDELTARLATSGTGALRATKRLLNEMDGSLDADLVRRGATLSAMITSSDEAQAALRARLKP